jgi:hypothetical protein
MTRLTLGAEAYWKLRALCCDTQRLQVMQQAVTEQIATAKRKQDACLADLALEHGLPEHLLAFSLEDDTLTLVIPEGLQV